MSESNTSSRLISQEALLNNIHWENLKSYTKGPQIIMIFENRVVSFHMLKQVEVIPAKSMHVELNRLILPV